MKRLPLFFFFLSALIPLSTYARCGDTPPPVGKLLDLSLEELFNIKIEVASKKQEQLFDAPSSVTVFTRREITAMGVDSVEELLNFVPGFSSSREVVFSDGYMVSARGRTTPQASYNILFLVDGQRLNNDRSGGALVHHRFISLHNVERVEVIRGPGSALYGTSAFSGVVNIITSDTLNEAYVGMGSSRRKEAHLNLSQAGENWRVALSARAFADQGEAYANLVDPRQGKNLDAKGCFDRLRVQLRHQQRKFDGYTFGEEKDVLAQIESQFIRAQYRVFEDSRYHLDAFATYSRQQLSILNEIVSKAAISSLSPGLVNGTEAVMSKARMDEREWHLGLEGRYQLDDQHELFAGLDWRQADNFRDRAQSNYLAADPSAIVPGSMEQPITYAGGEYVDLGSVSREGKRTIRSVYLQDKYRINEQWATTLGIRYDHYSDFGGTVNPRFSLLHAPNDHTSFKLLYGEAFRAPSIRQLSGVPGNPDLQPEKLKTLELAWLNKFAVAQTTATWFYSRNTDLIDTRPRATGQGRQFQNVEGRLDTAGWEWEVAMQPRKNFSLRAAYSHLYKTEENPRRFPRRTFSAIANYQMDPWNFNLSVYHHSGVEQPTASGITPISGYWLASAHIRYSFNPRLTFSARVHNVLDAKIQSSVKPLGFTEGIQNRGRVYLLGLNWTF